MQNVKGPDANAAREELFCQLVERYQSSLLRMCCVYLKDNALAEDAVQETFVKAYRNLTTFRGESSEKTWLFHIAVNVCRDMKRGRWFKYIDRRVTPETLPIPSAMAEDDHEDLAQAIVLLPDKYKEVILLHYYQNMNLREIAQALGLSPSSVSNRLKKARERLRVLMERGNQHG